MANDVLVDFIFVTLFYFSPIISSAWTTCSKPIFCWGLPWQLGCITGKTQVNIITSWPHMKHAADWS